MVLTASEARKQARESLKGKWGIVVLISLVYLVYNFLVSLLSVIPVLGFIVLIAGIVIDIPLAYGFMMSMMKLKRGEQVGYFDFFKDGFANFGRAWGLTGRLILKMIIPILLVIVAVILLAGSMVMSLSSLFSSSSSNALAGVGILVILAYVILIAAYVWIFIKAFSYALSMYIAIDNSDMRPLDCVNKSKELMNGHKGRLFCLYISFIGWMLLAAVVSLIPFVNYIVSIATVLLLLPYIQFATIVFYENRAGIDSSATVAEGNVSSDNTNNTSNTIKEQSGSQDVKAEIVDIPNTDEK